MNRSFSRYRHFNCIALKFFKGLVFLSGTEINLLKEKNWGRSVAHFKKLILWMLQSINGEPMARVPQVATFENFDETHTAKLFFLIIYLFYKNKWWINKWTPILVPIKKQFFYFYLSKVKV